MESTGANLTGDPKEFGYAEPPTSFGSARGGYLWYHTRLASDEKQFYLAKFIFKMDQKAI